MVLFKKCRHFNFFSRSNMIFFSSFSREWYSIRILRMFRFPDLINLDILNKILLCFEHVRLLLYACIRVRVFPVYSCVWDKFYDCVRVKINWQSFVYFILLQHNKTWCWLDSHAFCTTCDIIIIALFLYYRERQISVFIAWNLSKFCIQGAYKNALRGVTSNTIKALYLHNSGYCLFRFF